jgi:hypothetical protein
VSDLTYAEWAALLIVVVPTASIALAITVRVVIDILRGDCRPLPNSDKRS